MSIFSHLIITQLNFENSSFYITCNWEIKIENRILINTLWELIEI